MRRVHLLPLLLLLAACHRHGNADEASATSSTVAMTDVGAGEILRLIGTEPFWGGTLAHGKLTYTTPQNENGEPIMVSRFAGRDGLGFNGTHAGAVLELAVSDTACNDGMSDRTYPYTATLMIDGQTRLGCAWTGRRPFHEQHKP